MDLAAVYICMVHISHVYMRPRCEYVACEPGFHPALEIDPHEPWEVITARSHARRFIAFQG